MFGVRLSKMGSASKLGLIAKAIAILRKYGADAHVYLPGIGTVNGLTAGNYLDSAGTTAATVDNPVGLSLDALQAMTLGSELAPALSAGNGWTADAGWSLGANQVSATAAGTGSGTYKALGTTNGNTYQVTFTLSGYASGSCYATLFNGVNGPAISANGTYTCTLTRNFVTDLTGVAAATANFTGTISGLSVKQIPGIHATQATTANKPILRRGLLNQLLWSQDTSNVAWVKTQATISSGIADPLGGTNARRIVEQSGAITNAFINNFASKSAASLPYTSASIVKAAGRNFAWVQVNDGAGNGCRAFVSLVDGSITSAAVAFGAGFSAPVASVLQIYPGWWLIALSGTTNSAAGVYNHTGISNDGTTFAYTGNGTSGIDTFGLGVFQGTLTAQQILDAGGIPLTTTAAASNPSAGKYSWQFDGSNDSLSLSAPLFQMSDDHAVIAGVSKTASASDKYAFAVANSASATPLCAVLVLSSDGIAKAFWRGDDAVLRFASSSISYSGSTKVVSARKVGNSKICRVNSVSGTPETSAIGATTLDASYIGVNTPAAPSYFDGSIYPVIAIKGTVTDSDLLTLERFVGQLSGVQI